METKQLPINSLNLKFTDGMKFSGYASIFNGVDSYGDTIAEGAYKNTISERERPIRMRWNHYGDIIGKWLTFKEDKHGLFVEGELTPNHSKANDVYASLKHGAIDGLSIGYTVKQQEETGGTRLLKEIELVEISIVEEPADLGAKIGEVKSALENIKNLRDFESLLSESGGFSKDAAVLLVSRMKSFARSESLAQIREEQAIREAFGL